MVATICKKRYLIQVSGYNLGLIMRLLTGFGTPRQWADAKIGVIWLRYPIDDQQIVLLCCLVVIDAPDQTAILGIQAAVLTR